MNLMITMYEQLCINLKSMNHTQLQSKNEQQLRIIQYVKNNNNNNDNNDKQ